MKKVRMLLGFVLFSLIYVSALSAQPEKPVSFLRDSLQLVGMLHLPAERAEPVPAVLMLHGFTGNKAETHFLYTRLARQLATQGIAALRFDFAGSGDSQGEFADMTILTELTDARVALDFLRQRPEVDANNIGLLGFSLGGCVAVLLASEMPAFKTMVLWAPVAQPAETFAYIPKKAERKQLNGRSVFDLRGYYVGERFMEALPGIRPLDAAEEIAIPVLVVQGTEDKSVDLAGSSAYLEIFRKKAPGSRLEIVEGAGHTFSTLEFTNLLTRVTIDYILAHLK